MRGVAGVLDWHGRRVPALCSLTGHQSGSVAGGGEVNESDTLTAQGSSGGGRWGQAGWLRTHARHHAGH